VHTVGDVAEFTGTHELGPGVGRVLVKTGRAGLAARAGHDLTLEITRWSARVTVPDAEGGGAAAATVTAELDLGSLAVRAGTGGAKPLTDRDRRDIQGTAGKILGETAKASFTSSRVIPSSSASGATAGGAIEGTLTMRGTSRPLRLQVVSPAPGRYRGSATVRQTDFGITPYSGFFGTLKLKDEIAVEFEVTIKEIPNGSA
jgi:polyisoprenoid-binding protein YceI